ncbi:DUF1127 domain-containing protein [Sagittula sp. S175]|uniref:DUF1127 domain-containing protein n=1 Tax=Sagittula sp. S175 TaxID=3415129 RepID=UPI003C7B23BE
MTRDNVQLRMGHTSLNRRIDTFFVERGLGFNPSSLRRSRLREIIELEVRTDHELADIGLTRDQILPHVFRDLLAA